MTQRGTAARPVARAGRGALSVALAAALALQACGGGGGGGASSPSSTALPAHVLDRLGFGPTPASLAALESQGVDGWIAQQLWPASIDEASNAPLQQLLAQIPLPASEHDDPDLDQLIKLQLVRAVYGRRQLEQRMVLFWEDHFSTDFGKLLAFTGGDFGAATWFEWRDNDAFRAHALGRFEDLLVASATGPAMLVFLDSIHNSAGLPNENYARELVELHTLGVDNGYTEADVEEIARCFTGWTVCRVAPGSVDDPLAPCAGPGGGARWAFHFDAALHDGGPKTIFAGTGHALHLPARAGAAGLQDGLDLLVHLARLPLTARFVCTKLAAEFVREDPPQALVDACVATWLATGGDLREVLSTLFASASFRDPTSFGALVESPLESVCATARALGAVAPTPFNFTNMRAYLDGAPNQQLFRWFNPDGYPGESELQLGTAKMLGRVAFNQTVHTRGLADLQYDLRGLLLARGVPLDDAPAIVAFLFGVLLPDRWSAADHAEAVRFLTTDEHGQPAPLLPNAVDYERRLEQLAAFVASFPQAFVK